MSTYVKRRVMAFAGGAGICGIESVRAGRGDNAALVFWEEEQEEQVGDGGHLGSGAITASIRHHFRVQSPPLAMAVNIVRRTQHANLLTTRPGLENT